MGDVSAGGRPEVLVVDDEGELADLYAVWLADEYEVHTAYGGEEAIAKLDGVDAVILDRRMPEVSGDEVLAAIDEREASPYVAMVTAVEPDFDIVGMGFDHYLVKPVTREELLDTVDQLLSLERCHETTRELFGLAEKRAALESRKSEEELRANAEYGRLLDRMEHLQEQTDQLVADLDQQSYRALMNDLTGTMMQ